jgi:hypothetical protein
LQSAAARSLAGNAMADALPFFEALAGLASASASGSTPASAEVMNEPLALPLARSLALVLRIRPFARRIAAAEA